MSMLCFSGKYTLIIVVVEFFFTLLGKSFEKLPRRFESVDNDIFIGIQRTILNFVISCFSCSVVFKFQILVDLFLFFSVKQRRPKPNRKEERDCVKSEEEWAVVDFAHCWENWGTKDGKHWTLIASNGRFSMKTLAPFSTGSAPIFVPPMSFPSLSFPSYLSLSQLSITFSLWIIDNHRMWMVSLLVSGTSSSSKKGSC